MQSLEWMQFLYFFAAVGTSFCAFVDWDAVDGGGGGGGGRPPPSSCTEGWSELMVGLRTYRFY